MIMEKHYYLLNGTVKVSDIKMPDRLYNGSIPVYSQWLSSLQPCEIDESELDKVIKYLNNHFGVVYGGEANNNPIDITDIVQMYYERCDDCEGMCYTNACKNSKLKLRFKQPKKQVESDLWQEFLEWKRKQNNK